MTLDSDALVERRRLRRRVNVWRTLALLVLGVAIVAAGARLTGIAGGRSSAHVARVQLSGVILGNEQRTKMFKELEESSNARAVLLVINSPGGGVAASEQLYDQLRRLAAKKPVVALMDQMAASGGYVAALGGDRIFAHQTTLTGSIGVLAQYPNFTDLLGKLGVQVEAVRSMPLKAAPSGFEPTSPEARAALESVVMDSFAWFKNLVGERRNLSGAALERVTDGRVFSGRQARELGLVDDLGGEPEARAWLAAERKIPADLPVVDWRPAGNRFAGLPFARAALAALADIAGLSPLAEALRGQGLTAGTQMLDGVLAVWHPFRE